MLWCWSLCQHSHSGELYHICTLTSYCVGYCFLSPLLIQMTQIWTISVEHAEYLQIIYCPREQSSGCGRPHETSCSICSVFCMVLSYYSCSSYHIIVVIFWKGASCRYWLQLVCVNVCLCVCDQPVVKSHFIGILHFIIQMTCSKNFSLQFSW